MSDATTPTSSVRDVVTGSTGNAIQDGTARGAILALVNVALGLMVLNVDLDEQEIALIYSAVNPALILVFAAYDRWLR